MFKSRLFAAAILAGLMVPQVQAQDLSYSFVELAYTDLDFDIGGGDVSGDGFTGAASFELSDTYFLRGEVGQTDFDFGVDLDQYEVGLGARTSLSDTTDLYGTVSFVDWEVSQGQAGSVDDTGYGLAVGIRSMVAPNIELNGEVGYVDIFDDNSTGLNVGGRYYFTETFSLGVNYLTDDDVDGFSISGRFNF